MPGGAAFRVRVVPGAARDRVPGLEGGVLRVEVRAPARGGRANQALLALLAECLAVDPARLAIVRGTASPGKWVRVAGMSGPELQEFLSAIRAEG